MAYTVSLFKTSKLTIKKHPDNKQHDSLASKNGEKLRFFQADKSHPFDVFLFPAILPHLQRTVNTLNLSLRCIQNYHLCQNPAALLRNNAIVIRHQDFCRPQPQFDGFIPPQTNSV
ncbi:hypothetical protein TM63_20685 [Salmonella enterica subsp. salamae serovar 42:f,g,t:--]|nr:hypothetical protein TM63_20685 [Salmonella enterica subsp. salamae serovar 42:f,g,t:--]